MPPPFEIRILSHGWLEEADPEYDLCSHGTLELLVNGTRIVTPEDGDFCLSAAALHLLRTKVRDHTAEDPVTLAWVNLVPHDGNAMYPDDDERVQIDSCPIGVNWHVRHVDSTVIIDAVRFFPTTNTDDVRDFEVSAVLLGDDWRRTVDRFAREVADLFTGVTKKANYDFDADGFRCFWREFRNLLEDRAVGPPGLP